MRNRLFDFYHGVLTGPSDLVRLADRHIVTAGLTRVLQFTGGEEVLDCGFAVGALHAFPCRVGNNAILFLVGKFDVGHLAFRTSDGLPRRGVSRHRFG